MDYPEVPSQLVAGIARFRESFISVAVLRGWTKDEAATLADLIPESLCGAPCFLDKLTYRWLYAYGEPVTLPGGQVRGIGITYHSLVTLIEVLACARVRLPESVFKDYITRAVDPKKHADMLSEFAPILPLASSTKVEYEVTGQSPGNRRIDWLLVGEDGFAILLEVKLREADLIRGLGRIQAGDLTSDGKGPAPDHDHNLLFRSVEHKFLLRPPDQMVQGVWIHTALMQERGELERSFMSLDSQKVHFAILGSWEGGVHFLGRGGVPKDRVLQLLQVKESSGRVFNRQADN